MDATAVFAAIAAFVTIVALASYLNDRFFRLPMAIGLMVIGLLLSFAVIALHAAGLGIDLGAENFLRQADFSNTLMRGLLSFLLFAGALKIDLGKLRQDGIVVGLLATAGVVISTFLVGTAFYYALRLVDMPLSYGYCLVFGALISPTDPVAVLAVFDRARSAGAMFTKIAGESLFNDGVGVVAFTVALKTAMSGGPSGPGSVLGLIASEALGGVAFGLAAGWAVYLLLKSVDNYSVEILLTLALVSGGYGLATLIGVSGPLAMVAAGLLIGSRGRSRAMSETTRRNLDMFWELVAEFLNAALFVWIGLEILVLSFDWGHVLAGLMAIPVTLLARYLSVGATLSLLRPRGSLPPGSVRLMTWGGLRGALAIAMALAIPPGLPRDLIVPVTYVVVVFSVLVQGLTIGPLLERSLVSPRPGSAGGGGRDR
jgi:CPA1 family monovalent cation:H+ antiporter